MDGISFKDKSKIIYLLGSLILLIGLSSAFIAPIEIYSYYLFSKGGRFYFEGFGMGSLMFANITIQVIAYYLIAVLFIILGYGHLKLREWARSLSVAVLWAWMVIGAPLTLVLIFMFTIILEQFHPKFQTILFIDQPAATTESKLKPLCLRWLLESITIQLMVL